MMGLDVERARYLWEEKYHAAILETDNSALPGPIADAILAIHARLEKMDIDPAKAEERSAISDALGGLKKLEEERLGEGSGG